VAQRRRRRSKQSSQNASLAFLFLAVLLLVLVFAVIAALEEAWPYLALILGAILAFDVGAHARAVLRGREPPPRFRVTRKLLSIAAYPFRTGWRWLRAVAGVPYVEPVRVESIAELLMLTATEFEEAVAQALRDHGYGHVRCRGGPGDLGVDITCVDPNGERLAIQCKRYASGNLVGSRELQLFIGMIHTEHDVDRGLYVTTSGFTAPARDLAARHGIRLLGGRDLARTFGFDRPPSPPRFQPERTAVVDEQTATAAADGTVFCEMSEEELVALEEMLRRLHVAPPVEIIRPSGGGRRGVLFASTDAMRDAARLLEGAADRFEAGDSDPEQPKSPRSYKRRAQNAAIIDMLENGGARSYELPHLPPS
jgi:restriction system protein